MDANAVGHVATNLPEFPLKAAPGAQQMLVHSAEIPMGVVCFTQVTPSLEYMQAFAPTPMNSGISGAKQTALHVISCVKSVQLMPSVDVLPTITFGLLETTMNLLRP